MSQVIESFCPACQGRSGSVISTRDGKSGEPLTVVQCEGCGLGHLSPMPTRAELEDWYARQYRQAYKGAVTPRMRHVLRAARIVRERWTWLRSHATFKRSAPALDIGASSGEWVYLMSQLGMEARGIEPHLGYSAFARETLGLNVVAGSLHQHLPEMPEGGFSLITMFHVFEHLADPVASLRAIARVLAPTGFLFIEVPDSAGMSAPGNTFFRAHTLYFTAHSLVAVARAAGLEMVANNFEDHANLRILLRKADAAGLAAQAAQQDALPAWSPDQGLRRGLALRRWHNYLWHGLRSGQPWRKQWTRIEERREASRHADVRALLDATYRDCLSRG